MENTESVEVQQPSTSPLTLFGKPIIQTKCQRDAFLYGIPSGITIGLITFLFTSHVKYSTHVSVGSYVMITLGYSCHCIYNEYKMRKEVKMIKRAMRKAALEEKNSSDLYKTV